MKNNGLNVKHFRYHITNVPSIRFFLRSKTSLLGGHFSHLSKNILYTRSLQRAHKTSVKLLTLMCHLYLI